MIQQITGFDGQTHICFNINHKHRSKITMGDIGKKIRVGHWDEPIPMPQFSPVKKPVEVPIEVERELVPVKRIEKEMDW